MAKPVIEYDILTPPDFSVKDRPLRNPGLGHLLQTQSLRAQLDPIAIILLGLAAFELNRTDSPIPNQIQEHRGIRRIGHLFNLDYIQPAIQPQDLGLNPHPRELSQASAEFTIPFVDAFMECPAFSRALVFLPNLFQMNESGLAWAKGHVLQS